MKSRGHLNYVEQLVDDIAPKQNWSKSRKSEIFSQVESVNEILKSAIILPVQMKAIVQPFPTLLFFSKILQTHILDFF